MIDLINKKIELDHQVLSGSRNDINKLNEIVELVSWAINNPKLRKFIVTYKYFYRGQYCNNFAQTDKSNAWHLRKFVEGNEREKTGIDYKWSYKISFYFKGNRVIGYTNTGSEIININRKYFDRSQWKVANTLIHEACHIYGMIHSFRKSNLWPYTAPYAIGNKAEELIKVHLGVFDTTETIQQISKWRRFTRWFRRVL